MNGNQGENTWTDTAKQRATAVNLATHNQRERAEIERWLLAEMKKLLPVARKQARLGKPALLRLIARHVKQASSSPGS